MSFCNFTKYISPQTCLGDSLATFNANFSALDQEVCDFPKTISNSTISVDRTITEQLQTIQTLNPKNSFVYRTTFDTNTVAFPETINLPDGTTMPATTFPRTVSGPNPTTTFTTPSVTNNSPAITVYWTANGNDNMTVYATNSSVSFNDNGTLGFNGTVNALLRNGNTLYVGGEFTEAGGVSNNKFAIVDLEGGLDAGLLGKTGAVVSNPFSTFGNLGTTGSVNAIAQSGDLLIVGGSFINTSLTGGGRGLTVVDTSTNTVYPFYVNGTVNALHVIGTNLYVGGEFDYVNYGRTSASIASGLRKYTNGFVKIVLPALFVSGIGSITNFPNLFTRRAIVNTIASKGNILYLGGEFQIKPSQYIKAQNLVAITESGVQTDWQPIVGGPVFTLTTDTNYLYVGGNFASYQTATQFYSNPRLHDQTTAFSNSFCANIFVSTNPVAEQQWKPEIRGTISKIIVDDDHVYCYGMFDSFLAAFSKPPTTGVKIATWKPLLETAPFINTNGLEQIATTLIVGGKFRISNNKPRFYLTRINKVSESLLTDSLSSVVWHLGGQIADGGCPLQFNTTLVPVVSSIAYPTVFGTVNATTFNPIDLPIREGQLIRFYLQRQDASQETFAQNVHVIGWKADFNR